MKTPRNTRRIVRTAAIAGAAGALVLSTLTACSNDKDKAGGPTTDLLAALAHLDDDATRQRRRVLSHLQHQPAMSAAQSLLQLSAGTPLDDAESQAVRDTVARAAKPLVVSTFHSLGVRILRGDGQRIGLKEQFSILDSDDVTSILKDAGGSTDVATARQWQWTISAWKSAGLNAAQAEAQASGDEERLVARVMANYEERLAAYQSVDFDDLMYDKFEISMEQFHKVAEALSCFTVPMQAGISGKMFRGFVKDGYFITKDEVPSNA